jgi:hypothetical protein
MLFLLIIFPLATYNSTRTPKIFQKFAKIFSTQCDISDKYTVGVVEICNKIAAGVIDAGVQIFP